MDYIDIGSFEYYLRMFFEIFFFYVLFMDIYAYKFNRKKLFFIILFIPISFIGQIYLRGSAEVLASIFCYWLLKDTASNKYLLLNALALSANIPYLINTTVSSLIMNMESLARLSDIEYISVELFYEVLFLLGIIGFFYLIRFRLLLIKYSSKLSFELLAINYFFIQCYLYAADYFDIYEQFILGTTGLFFFSVLFCFLFLLKK